jgi:4-hydroxybenzoate polyprenyltransferase
MEAREGPKETDALRGEMVFNSPSTTSTAVSRLKLFLALSRTPHGLLDMATPALATLLWLGKVPPVSVVVLGIITGFAGYTAVYALNDVVDFRTDQKKMRTSGPNAVIDNDLDAVYVRHPMAQGLLPFRDGLAWAVGWALVAFLGAYLLNPVCAMIFVIGCLLETVYCLLLRVTYLRALVSGVVKTLGGLAAVYAVDLAPSPLFVVALFLWLFAWEIGGQNVPNDWADIEEDQRLQARTIPVHFGAERTSQIIVGSLALAVLMSVLLIWLAPARIAVPSGLLIVAAGGWLLVFPSYLLCRDRDRRQAAVLFNRASYYPFVIFLIIIVNHLIINPFS